MLFKFLLFAWLVSLSVSGNCGLDKFILYKSECLKVENQSLNRNVISNYYEVFAEEGGDIVKELNMNSVLLKHTDIPNYLQHEVVKIKWLKWTGNFDKAFLLAESLKQLPHFRNTLNGKYALSITLSGIYSDLNLHSEALKYNLKIIQVGLAQKNYTRVKGGLIYLSFDLAHDSTKSRNLERALICLEKAEELDSEKFDPQLYGRYGHVYFVMGDFERAEQYYLKSLQVRYPDTTSYGYWGGVYNIINAQFEQKKYDKVLPKALLCFDEMDLRNESFQRQRDLAGIIADIYEDLNQVENALIWTKKKDAYDNREELGSRQLDSAQMAIQINYSRASNQGLQKIVDKSNTVNTWQFVVILVLIIGLVIVVVFYFKQRKKHLALVREGMSRDLLEEKKIEEQDSNEKNKDPLEFLLNEEVHSKLKKMENDLLVDKLYKRSDLNLSLLSKMYKTNTVYISRYINNRYGMTFRELINTLRINEAKEVLLDIQYKHYSIEGVAQDVGYKNISVFNTNFKRIIGVTPSFYRTHGVNQNV